MTADTPPGASPRSAVPAATTSAPAGGTTGKTRCVSQALRLQVVAARASPTPWLAQPPHNRLRQPRTFRPPRPGGQAPTFGVTGLAARPRSPFERRHHRSRLPELRMEAVLQPPDQFEDVRVAWRAADSLSLRAFLHLAPPAAPPDHSTISRTRRLFPVETHQAVFTWVLQQLAEAGLVQGKTVGIDATTLEANVAMRSIVRRDSGEDYTAFLTRLAKVSGIETPTAADLARFDRKRKKKTSNKEWTHPHDPDAKVAKMKDGRTHMAHKAEHAVDLETGAVVGVTIQGADTGDTTTMVETVIAAAEQVEAVLPTEPGMAEVVADKEGYHSNETMVDLAAVGVRSYIAEPDRGRRCWKGAPEARDAVYANRRRIRGNRGRELLRRRGELLERPFAHLYDTGGMRRVHLRGHSNILKRVLVHVAGGNLGLLLRHLTGVGTPRGLQGRVVSAVWALIRRLVGLWGGLERVLAPFLPDLPSTASLPRYQAFQSSI